MMIFSTVLFFFMASSAISRHWSLVKQRTGGRRMSKAVCCVQNLHDGESSVVRAKLLANFFNIPKYSCCWKGMAMSMPSAVLLGHGAALCVYMTR
jgi:hypothetical protein